jgi:hypothetical protein
MKSLRILLAPVLVLAAAAIPSSAVCAETWTEVGHDSFPSALVAPRSQGVVAAPTVIGGGWVFSGLNGLMEKTDDAFHTLVLRPMPADAVEPEFHDDGTNYLTGTHIGDIDYYDGKIYASLEDGEEGEDPVKVNTPEYQHPYIAEFDAQTLLYLGKHPLPLERQVAGVPWVAADGPAGVLYTSEWDQPHNVINVYDIHTFAFLRTIPLVYPPSFGEGFKLNRIQGAKVLGGALYASRDDDAKSVFKIDLTTGAVTKLFSLDPPADVPSEMEGIAVRVTPEGTFLDVMLILHNDFDESLDFANIVTNLHHFKLSCT